MGIHDQFRQPENLSDQVERISETRLFTLLRRERLDRLQVHVVVEMQVVEILSVNQEVEHIVPLATDLETGFDPVQRGRLEELGVL